MKVMKSYDKYVNREILSGKGHILPSQDQIISTS